MSLSYLDLWLAPLRPWLDDPAVTDICINRPGEIWVERRGQAMECLRLPEMDGRWLWHLARQIASQSDQGISRSHPLLSASLGEGLRVQIVAPPVAMDGVALAIRKHGVGALALDQWERAGASPTPMAWPADRAAMLRQMVQARRNILICGGTASGKTTLMNSLLAQIPPLERLVLIEDAAELSPPHANQLRLIAARGGQGEARVDVEDLLQASLRLRPDRLLLGEIRGAEAYSYLRAINSGHPGSISTIHADSPQGALEQLALILLQAGSAMRREDILAYLRSAIDAVVMVERSGGQRRISEILVKQQGGLSLCAA
jgi:type IV secretion system protein VirB11